MMSKPNQIFTGDGSLLNNPTNISPSPSPSSIETMNDLLGSGYQIINLGKMDPVVLAKLPDEDLAPKNTVIYHSNERKPVSSESEPESSLQKPEKTTDDYIFQFYLGSLTVVGLFILFRMIQKSK
jgi:hypothetical protein